MVASADYAEIDDIYYNLDTRAKTASVTMANEGNYLNSISYSGSFTIPASVIYNDVTYSVTSIDASAFHDCRYLTSITIPNSVTKIVFRAFYGCTSLTSITISNSVTSIEPYTFQGCSSLAFVTIPNSVTEIGGGGLYG